MFDSIEIQQPQPNDIVGAHIRIAGLATGFEANINARVRDGNGQQVASTSFMGGGASGEIGQFQAELELAGPPTTPGGFVEVYDENTGFPREGPFGGRVAELDKVVVPVVFGTNLLDSYMGFTYHVVLEGDTLSAIAKEEYGDPSKWPVIYEANRDQIGDPDLIFSGQRLRIPR